MIIARLVGSVSVVSSKINLSMLACTILSTVGLLTERLARPMERRNSVLCGGQAGRFPAAPRRKIFLQSIRPNTDTRLYNIAHFLKIKIRPTGDNQTPRRLN